MNETQERRPDIDELERALAATSPDDGYIYARQDLVRDLLAYVGHLEAENAALAEKAWMYDEANK